MKSVVIGLGVYLFSLHLYAAVSLLAPEEQAVVQSNTLEQAGMVELKGGAAVIATKVDDDPVSQRLLSRLDWPQAGGASQRWLANRADNYQLRYPQLQQRIYAYHPQALWYGYAQARKARDQLQWLLFELSLAGAPEQISRWLVQLNIIDSSDAQWESLYTDAFLGVIACYQQLMALDYSQSMALNHIAELPLQLFIDQAWIANLNQQQVYQQVMTLRGELDIERLRYRQQMLYWLNVAQQRTENTRIANGPLIRLGDSDPRVPLIRERLIEFDSNHQLLEQNLPLFESETYNALQRFQQQHGLKADGIVGKDTLYWLNFQPLERSKMLAKNLLRQQLLDRFLVMPPNQQRIVVNVPAYQMSYIDQDIELFRSKVVVGRASRATPLLVSEISSVVINPYWNVPRTIVRRDIIPKLRLDPSYVQRLGFELFDYQGQAVEPEQVDWTLVKDTGRFPYRMRQRPGSANALGNYKFYFANQFAVYLHDTSSPELFSESQRAFSSGCVRVEAAESLAEQLLKQDGYSQRYKQSLMAKGEPKWLPLRKRVPVYLVYFTSWFDSSGSLNYRKDIYNFDPKIG
ncbi:MULTISPECIES: L,D-transpeptidase family protein [unclassified Agarivorans]|uniref:L,D-transpeptidase family protein n=1 Tax=unclassified Agarivorans TaxID=2636026 RepID=UPI003D7DCC3A